MPDKNALAELALDANLLILDRTAYSSHEAFVKACETKNKVVLILNELSNVEFHYIDNVAVETALISANDAVMKCRKIAEEGKDNG